MIRKRQMGMMLAGSALLLVGLAGSAVAQPSLQRAMLYGDSRGDPFERGAASAGTSAPLVAADTLRDPWLGRDKVLHAAGSFLLTLSAQYVLVNKLDTSEGGALPIAAGAAFSLGLAKEVADSRRRVNPLFSVRDLTADAFGIALAIGLILL